MSDRNLNLQQRSLADRSKDILLGYPLANWSDNLRQLHADFLARIDELERPDYEALRAENEKLKEERDSLILDRAHMKSGWDSATLQAFKNGGNANYLRSERDALQAQVNFFNEEKIKAGINWHKETNSWNPIIKPGQVKVGDKLKFKIGDKEYRETAKQILNQGTDKEEVIYNIQKNFYFITSMIISGFSNHKFVEVLEQK
jgi:hypothetical protein